MVVESKVQLNKESIETIQGLIRINIDSQKSFEEAAEKVEHAGLSGVFRDLADERANQVVELRSLILHQNETAETEGTFGGTARRFWVDLRSALGGGKQMILDEAERCEDQMKAKYEEALKCCHDSPAAGILDHQYTAVKRAHDMIRDLRNSNRDKAK